MGKTEVPGKKYLYHSHFSHHKPIRLARVRNGASAVRFRQINAMTVTQPVTLTYLLTYLLTYSMEQSPS